MKKEKNKEIEKKFLIKYPRKDFLDSIPSCDISEIVQTYLISEEGVTRRVRSRRYADEVRYTKTEKRRISDMSCFEDEREISESEYLDALEFADPTRCQVKKTRLLKKSGAHIFEIDIYPFWIDRAIMEVELSSEDESFTLPKDIEIIRDVTSDHRYKNISLAYEIPNE
ncbi:MAG: hypothetical protein IKT56_05805 [Clostridia bacterium]|nr:hypothetical protein [Clostridia bacterium]